MEMEQKVGSIATFDPPKRHSAYQNAKAGPFVGRAWSKREWYNPRSLEHDFRPVGRMDCERGYEEHP
jgi:hypothetical protein